MRKELIQFLWIEQWPSPNIDYYQADLILNKGDSAALAAAISDAMICAGLPDGAAHEAVAAQSAQQAAHRAVDMGERDFRSNLKSLRLVISTMGDLPGQRILIFVSPGFLTFSEEAMELKSQLLEIASQANVTINAIDVRGLSPRILRQPMPAEIRGPPPTKPCIDKSPLR